MHSSTQHAALTGTKRMYRAFAQNDPEHRARRKLERAAARRRNDQNWGALWAAPAAAPEPVAAPPPASPDDAAAPAPAPETAARDAEPAAALVALLRARDEPAAAAALSHEEAAEAAAPSPLHDDAAAPPPPPPPHDWDDESPPLRLPATGQTGTQWSQWTTGPASQRAASQWATPPPPAWDDALRRRLRAAAPVDANAACVAYAADERARAALPTMNVSRGDVDALFAPEEESWD